jgi:hypothetical protein
MSTVTFGLCIILAVYVACWLAGIIYDRWRT